MPTFEKTRPWTAPETTSGFAPEIASENTAETAPEAARETGVATQPYAHAGAGVEGLRASIELARRLDADGDARAPVEAAHALEQAERGGDAALEAEAADCLALCQLHQGSFDGALENVYRAIGLWRQRADLSGESGSRALHAQVLLELGEVDEALEEARVALQLAESAQDSRQRANASMVAGFVYRTLGRGGDARSFFEQAMALSRWVDDRRLLARALCNLGNIHSDMAALRRREGRPDFGRELLKALDLYHQSLHLFKELGDARLEANALRNIALVHGDLGDHAAAFEMLGEQLAHARETGNQVGAEVALRLIGRLHLDRKEHALAVECLSEAVGIAADLRRLECEWLSHEMLSKACEALGDPASALRHFKRFHALQAQVITERNEHRGRAFALQYQTERAKADAEAQRLRALALERSNLELERKAQALSDAACEDPLTGLYNRRQLDAAMQAELRQRGQVRPYSIAMLDIDFFKRVNDSFSHQAGDQVLRQVAEVLRRCCRQGDMAIRYGGEEFALVFLQALVPQAARVCERIRLAVQKHDWAPIHPELSVTVSIGIADNHDAGDPGAILALADKRLYAAKQGGRNCVVSGDG
jgi:diguanylate cyclase (GGDEF)-like protein